MAWLASQSDKKERNERRFLRRAKVTILSFESPLTEIFFSYFFFTKKYNTCPAPCSTYRDLHLPFQLSERTINKILILKTERFLGLIHYILNAK